MKVRHGDDGLHLFDRFSGINVLLDEVPTSGEVISQAPRFVSFALTNACDLKCHFCYAPKAPSSLKVSEVIFWAVELDRNGCLGIGFGGGEPTLFPGFTNLCVEISRSTELGLCFTTHAHRLTRHTCKALTGAVHYVRVSMDGIGATYEKIRGKSFSSLLKQIALVRDTCHFGINYVVNDDTIDSLEAASDLAQSMGASELLLLPDVTSGNLDSTTTDKLVRWIANYGGDIRLSISETSAIESVPLADPFTRERGVRAYVHVNASGMVSHSSYDQQSAVRIGSNRSLLDAIATLERGVK